MNKPDLLLLFQYNQWTTDKILEAASHVMPEQLFLAPAPFPHGGLRSTLVHTLFAQWIWRMRWEGTSPNYRLKPEEFPTFESLRTRFEEEGKLLMTFVESVPEERLNQRFYYNNTAGQPKENILWQAMVHLVNHGTQHKTEAAAILTGYGCSPGDIDMIYYFK
jgi:uncharacterized damage-inducible protein DinB